MYVESTPSTVNWKIRKGTKRATKLIIAVKSLKYGERLRYFNLPTLKYRRMRGDMIEVYKMFSGRYDATVTNWFKNRQIDKKYEVTSHRFCTHQFRVKFDMRKFNFTNRVISVWNTLPDNVVPANTICTFKARLDRFWSDQEVKYNWKSDIITGSRSQVSVIERVGWCMGICGRWVGKGRTGARGVISISGLWWSGKEGPDRIATIFPLLSMPGLSETFLRSRPASDVLSAITYFPQFADWDLKQDHRIVNLQLTIIATNARWSDQR